MVGPHGRMRVGVVGTGPWAAAVHVPAAAASRDVELVGVFGRNRARAAQLADSAGVASFGTFDHLVESVDVVCFAVPPSVQADMALAAARAGKHLLLEKPVALDSDSAHELADEVTTRGLASIVFFAQLLIPEVEEWLSWVRAEGGWTFGRIETLSSVLVDSNSPFNSSPWRHQQGALWDVGPHAISLACAVLGPAVEVSATKGPGDITSILLAHKAGAQASITVAGDIPASAQGGGAHFVGSAGRSSPPAVVDWTMSARAAYAAALGALVGQAGGGQPHVSGIGLGAHVVDILSAVESSIQSARRTSV
jgi:predicted dehydrogenase